LTVYEELARADSMEKMKKKPANHSVAGKFQIQEKIGGES